MAKNYYKPFYLAAFAILFGITQMAHAQNPNLDPLIDPASLTQDLTNSAQEVIAGLPTTDAAGVTAAAARMGAIATQAEALRVQSETTRTSQEIEVMLTPAELNGLVTRIPSTPLTPGTYRAKERSFEDGNNISDLALQYAEDYIVNSLDFIEHSDYMPSGICMKPSWPWPKFSLKEYYYFPLYGFESSSDLYRGRYLEQEIIRELYKSQIEEGDLLLFDDSYAGRYEMAKELAPREIERVKALAAPNSEAQQPSISQRFSNLIDTTSGSGSIEGVHEPAYQVGASTLKNLTKYGEVSALGRNIEMQFLPGLVNQFGIAIAGWLGLARVHESFNNPAGYFFHRTDNPLVFPFARSKSATDLLLLYNAQLWYFTLASSPGHCLLYDQSQLHGLPGAMGFVPEGNFGLLSKVHPDALSIGTLLSSANKRKCLKGGGSVYPLTNFVAGGKNFKSAFYTRFLRMNQLVDLYSRLPLVPAAPMFHQYKDLGSKFQSKIQIHDASFPFNSDPHPIDANTLDSHWTNPFYDNKRTATRDSDGLNIDIARGNMWIGIDACRRGYYPIIVWNGNWTQIRGSEDYSG